MKKPFLFRLFAFAASFLLLIGAPTQQARAQVGIGTTTPNAKAVLDLQSTGNDKGLLIPRLTQAQRLAMTSVPDGLMIFQTDDTTGFWYYFGGAWTNIPNATTAGDNLGNHTATQNLNLGTNKLIGNGGTTGPSIGSAGTINMADKDVLLRGSTTGDTNHGLGYYGPSKQWNGVSLDGPVLYGNVAGILGTNSGGSKTSVLTWNNFGNVGVGTTSPAVRLHVAGTAGTSNVRLESLGGTGSRVVVADASGNLGTVATTSLADNLGNHTATQNLNLAAN
jgi:hypothetical protein